MAHTPEMRDQNALCNARKRNGDKCRAFAGQGTSHPGIGACKFHGGATGTHEKAALQREAQQRMVTMGLDAPIEDVSALQALLQELWASTAHVSWLRQQLANLSRDELGTPYGLAITSLYNSERERKTKYARMAIESGVDEAAIRVADAQVTLMGRALSKACDTAGLSETIKRRIGAALRDELGALEAEPRSLAQLAQA
jgi:hypothetical protein